MDRRAILAAALALLPLAVPAGGASAADADTDLVARGRYLAVIGGCNDCHTVGYAEQAGNIPESDWLKGSPLGWHGPWGTTYPMNLRLLANAMSEAQWLGQLRTYQARPPMPWYDVRQMSDADLRAIYAFIRHLGPAGSEAPVALPPTASPPPPFVDFPAPPPAAR
jgi:mono/diheme cytochrome c family protein